MRLRFAGLPAPALVVVALLAIAPWVLPQFYVTLLNYVGLYSLWLKRGSVYGTLVGSLSGAAPPVVGYCAVSNEFDAGAAILLLIFSLWQMPHSYAIAIFRFSDYQRAGIPVLAVAKGVNVAKHHMLAYTVAFTVSALSLAVAGYTGVAYFAVVLLMGLYWLKLGLAGRYVVIA